MIKVSKNMNFQKIRQKARVVSTEYRQYLSVFYCFLMGRILESATDELEVKCNAKLGHSYLSVNVLVLAVVFH